jgi:hypothetical protein
VKERWKKIAGYPGYAVSNKGRVASFWRKGPSTFVASTIQRILKPMSSRKRYWRVDLRKHGCCIRHSIHLLVLTAFKGKRPRGLVARHVNGDRFDNAVRNLKWGTPKENEADKILHGTRRLGSKHANSKLTERAVRQIFKHRNQFTLLQLGKRFGVGKTTIHKVLYRQTWQHVKIKGGVLCPTTRRSPFSSRTAKV